MIDWKKILVPVAAVVVLLLLWELLVWAMGWPDYKIASPSDLWQTMRDLRAKEPFTCVLITHDLRESVFLGDQVVVLSGRPARTQYVLDVTLPADRTIDVLYEPKAGQMLHTLRDQIRIAQGREETHA